MKSNTSCWCESKVNRLWLLIITQTETYVIQRHLKLNSRAILMRNSSLSPPLLKTLIMLYRLGASDVIWQHLRFYIPSKAEFWTRPLIWKNSGLNSLNAGLLTTVLISLQRPESTVTLMWWWLLSHLSSLSLHPQRRDTWKPKTGSLVTWQLLPSFQTTSLLVTTQGRFWRPLRPYRQLPDAPGDRPSSPLEMPLRSALPHPGIPLCARGMS